MDRVISLYTTTQGRISRKTWWLGVLGLFAASVVLSIITSLLGFSAWANVPVIDPSNPDLEAFSAAMTGTMRTAAWVSLVMYVVLAYPTYCLSVKRRHDRDNAGLDVIIFMVLNAAMLLIQALGIGLTTVDVGNGMTMPAPSMQMSVVSGIIGIGGIYLLVVMGFLRGTAGANSYGADPLLGTE